MPLKHKVKTTEFQQPTLIDLTNIHKQSTQIDLNEYQPTLIDLNDEYLGEEETQIDLTGWTIYGEEETQRGADELRRDINSVVHEIIKCCDDTDFIKKLIKSTETVLEKYGDDLDKLEIYYDQMCDLYSKNSTEEH